MKHLLSLTLVLLFSSSLLAELNTSTYVSHDGGGAGAVTNNLNGSYTLLDAQGGDMWNGGDQFVYLHDSEQMSSDFTATVRVVSQTEAIDGRWGKAGIRASATMDGKSANAMAQIAAGNGSQPDGTDPVPSRISGRTTNDGENGFELPIIAADASEVPNGTFLKDGTIMTWLSLSYEAATNAFVAGIAPDVDGAPGTWSYSAPKTDVQGDGDGWYVGLAYSAHSDLNFDQVTYTNGKGVKLHGITFDSYEALQVPEPSSVALALVGMISLLGLRKRKN